MTDPTDRSRRHRLTVQGWQTLVLAIVGVLVIGAAAAGAVLLNRNDEVSRTLIDEVQPSRSAAYRLQAALRDQETAVRGYAIAADRQFLDRYYEGQTDEATAAADIRQRAASRPDLLADVDAIAQASAAWRASIAEPLIASVTPGAPNILSADVAERGKTAFDRLRVLFDVQNQHLTDARIAGIAALDQIRLWRNVVLGLVIAVLLATAVLLAIIMRNAVTRPLTALAASCRRITEGNFGERIVARGPKDIRAIAVDVEDMRQRIVDELSSTRSANARLDEQAEELRRSNAELEQFAYVASHDLQEPLRKVTAFCQLLEKRYGNELDERGVEYIAYAVDGAKRMQVLINDLLAFSRVGRHSSAHTAVALDDCLDAALANLTIAVSESGAEIVRPVAPLPRTVGDPTLLTMLWQNLIGNAIKFRRMSVKPRVVIDCRRGAAEDDWSLSVSDNGIGIAPEFVDKVFVIFQRLHGRDAYGGTGIGLALCKKIVEYHGGDIGIDTSYTGGTRLTFTLPAAPTAASPPRPAALSEGMLQ